MLILRRSDEEACPWQLADLTQLSELMLRSKTSHGAISELLGSTAVPVLPASLHTLRLETVDKPLYINSSRRVDALTSTAHPLLELTAETVTFSFSIEQLPAETDLPAGFRALWLRTGCITFEYVIYPGHIPATANDAAEELCCFLGQAPGSYREFRMFGSAEEFLYHPTQRDRVHGLRRLQL